MKIEENRGAGVKLNATDEKMSLTPNLDSLFMTIIITSSACDFVSGKH